MSKVLDISTKKVPILLFRFTTPCRGRQKQSLWSESSHKVRYDECLQLTVVCGDNGEVPAIEFESLPHLATKKNDIEKGEDNKDRGMWS